MLSEPAIKALNLYNIQAIAKHKGNRSANLHDITPPDNEEHTSTPNEEPAPEHIPSGK